MSQHGTGANSRYNDCGAASVSGVINGQTNHVTTVDEIAIKYQNPPNSNMYFYQIDNALNGYGMDGTRKQPYYTNAIHDDIVAGFPVICLVWYQSLPYQFDSFNGSHFITVYATNGELFRYRDPLATNDNILYITPEQLDRAMKDAQNNGNQPNQGMVCKRKPL